MKKTMILLAVIATTLASCSKDDYCMEGYRCNDNSIQTKDYGENCSQHGGIRKEICTNDPD